MVSLDCCCLCHQDVVGSHDPKEIMTIGSFTVTKPIALMLLFAVVMILASVSMIRNGKKNAAAEDAPMTYNYPMILLEGTLVGILTGLVGQAAAFLSYLHWYCWHACR